MKSSPFRNIVLPALIASSATFSISTLPLTSSKVIELTEHLPPVVRHLMTPAMTNHHKDVSIRYVGFVILASVFVGAGTAEIMRQRRVGASKHEELLEQALTLETQEEASSDWRDPSELITDTADATPLTAWQVAPEEATVAPWPTSPTTDGESFSEIASLNWHAESNSEETATESQSSLAAERHRLEILSEQAYPTTYRIQVPGNQRLLAIQNDGDYYSFYRRRPTAEQAKAVVNQLQRRGKSAIMAPDPKGYGIWIHQPDAVLDIAAWNAFKPAG